ncbi:BTAD domain-containing putative transcriptional regulator [Micromonospora sp. NPDC004551]|uniref:AfsR/SARP family transcriptional regulator n=1 Tax=Micromonospora sp. NPDC004551 TaxID=3154284 RepID=UPI00339E1108
MWITTGTAPETVPPHRAGWRLRLLGGFALDRDGEPVALPATAQRLVAFLAVRGASDRARTAWSMWASKPEERASADLRTALWRLRKAAPGLLADSTGALALAAGVTVDTRSLTGSVDPAFLRRHAAEGCPDLLPGWYDDWVLMHRELLRHRALRALEDAAGAAIRAGEPAAGLGWALEAVAADALRESGHRLVLTAMLADGNVSDALRHADLVVRLLAEQLGVRPSPQLMALIEEARSRSAVATGRARG